jgi:hypothetical protein
MQCGVGNQEVAYQIALEDIGPWLYSARFMNAKTLAPPVHDPIKTLDTIARLYAELRFWMKFPFSTDLLFLSLWWFVTLWSTIHNQTKCVQDVEWEKNDVEFASKQEREREKH